MDSARALEKVNEFIAMLRRREAISPGFYSEAPERPEFRALGSEINSRRPLIEAIADEVGPEYRPAITKGLDEAFKSAVGPCERLAGAISTQQEAREILEPQGPRLAAEALHPAVWGAAAHLRSGGHRRAALQQASAAVFDGALPISLGVPKKSPAAEPNNAFSRKDPSADQPRLRFSRIPRENVDDWNSAHDGARFLGMGCVAYIRNLTTHDTAEMPEPEALEQMAALSLFARLVDEAEVERA